MEPKREYLTTSTLFSINANMAMINSVAFPHVAFKRPPTTIIKHKLTSYICHQMISLLLLMLCIDCISKLINIVI